MEQQTPARQTRRSRALFPRPRVPWFVPHPNWRFTVLLAADLLLVFILPPVLSGHDLPGNFGSFLALIVTAGTIALVSDRRAVRLGVLGILVLAAAVQVLADQFSVATTSALQVGCAILIVIFLGQAIFSRGEVDVHRVAGGIALYLNLGFAFASGYVFLCDLSPMAFEGKIDQPGRIEEMIHFSLATLTTVGYGDIVPRSPAARSMADLEALIGQLFPATLLAWLVSLMIRRRD